MITTDHLMIDRRILQEALSLRDAGYEVELLAGFECSQSEDYDWRGIRISRFAYDWNDVRAQRVLKYFPQKQGRIWSLTWRATCKALGSVTGLSGFEHFVLRKVLIRSFDILHVHDFPLLKVGVEVKRRTGRPLVYDAHELYHAQSQLPRAVQNSYRRQEARLIRKADVAITVNEFIARIMAADYRCAMPYVILNAAPEQDMSGKRPDLRSVAGLPPDTRIILYQGWLSPERGIDTLVRSARHFPRGVTLVIIGYGAHQDELRRISTEQGCDDGRVVFLGRLEPDELANLTGSADLGVIPYWGIDLNNTYCSPNKLFEFAVSAVPFVSNDLPFLRSVIDRYGFGETANLRDPDAAAKAFLDILSSPQRLAGLRDAAKLASKELVWANEAQKLLAIYSNIEQCTPGKAVSLDKVPGSLHARAGEVSVPPG